MKIDRNDSLYEEVKKMILDTRMPSVALTQRIFRINHSRAEDLLRAMEGDVVTNKDCNGLRKMVSGETVNYYQNKDADEITRQWILKYSAIRNRYMHSNDDNNSDFSHIYSVGQLLSDGFREKLPVSGVIKGLPTGFTDLDNSVGGLQKGDLVVIGGRPSMGATSFAINVVQNAALTMGLSVVIFSMSMSAVQLTTRLISSRNQIDQNRLRCGRLTKEEDDRLNNSIECFRATQIMIDETVPTSCLELCERARQIIKNVGGSPGLILVDCVETMAENRELRTVNQTKSLAEISRSLKFLAKELQCPVLVTVQLSRDLEHRRNKRPILSDFRGSAGLGADADLILSIYRDEVYCSETTEDKEIAEIIICKNRNGPIGTVRLKWEGQYTNFQDLELMQKSCVDFKVQK